MQIARRDSKPTIHVLWVTHDDMVLDDHFRQRGFRRTRGMVHLSRSLDEEFAPATVPPGFSIRGCEGVSEVDARARAQYGAFQSKAPFEQYLRRFTNFMRSPVYDPELDIVAVSADGRIGAFCIVWIDPVNQIGLFEPVGTHPDYHRKGLGRAVMQEGLRRVQAHGMKSAIVSTNEDNPAAIKLYETAGFQVINRLGTYEKDV